MLFNRITISLFVVLVLAIAFVPGHPATAQDNLLENPGFNGPGQYHDERPAGSAYSFAFAPGWHGWQTLSPRTESWMNIEPIAFPHTGSQKYEGNASQNIGRGSGTFTAAAYQTVGNIPEGTTLRFRVWVFQESKDGSGARTRIGIGSNVGGNPLAPDITWSNWMEALRSWQVLELEATVPAGNVTVFIYSTQQQPKDPNQVYYDDSKLTAVGSGTPNVGGANATPLPTNTPRPVFAAFVSPQEADDTGRIEHVVQSGDTLAAIAVAYGVPLSEILELNGLERGAFLQVGQRILITEGGEEPTLAPATATPEADTTGDAGTGGGFASPTPQDVAVQPSAAATEVPTQSEPTSTPTETPVPPTPTDAPPAPVETGDSANPLALEAAVCVLMFNDVNQNNIRESEEALVANGIIGLRAENSSDEQQYVTTGQTEPHCFSNLATGSYVVNAAAPDGFGLRRTSLLVNVPPGQQFMVRFAAVEGLAAAVVPTTSPEATATVAPLVEESPDAISNLRNMAGMLVFALAGVILVGGIAAAIFASRR